MAKFLEIHHYLREKIQSKDYLPGDSLPSEHELAKKFNVSRGTIRKSLALLEEKGWIQKRRGKGSVVLEMRLFDFPVSGLTSYKELQQAQQIESETIVLEISHTTFPPAVLQFLNMKKTESAIMVKRLRRMKGEGIILDIDYFKSSIVADIPHDAAETSLYEYLEKTCGFSISYASKEFTVEPVTKEDRKQLTLNEDTHVVVTRSAVYLEDTRFFQYSESHHRADTFRFTDFARRRSPAMP